MWRGSLLRGFRLSAFERELKSLAFLLGLASAVCVVQDWQPWGMVFSLPFCLIWIYCAWLHTEPQLKWINVLFAGLYVYGIGRYVLLA